MSEISIIQSMQYQIDQLERINKVYSDALAKKDETIAEQKETIYRLQQRIAIMMEEYDDGK